MADTKISALSAAAALAGTEPIPTVQTGVTVATTPAALKVYTLTTPTTLTEAVGSSALTITGATQTASFPVINASQTWNNVATTFTAAKVNVTDTTSAAASLLLDLQIGGSSMFSVRKDGTLAGAGVLAIDNMTQTWNAGGTTFRAIKMNVTDTASASGSFLIDLQVAASSKFSVGKDGTVTAAGLSLGGTFSLSNTVRVTSTGFQLANGGLLTMGPINPLVPDVAFGRKAAKVIEINSNAAGTYAGCAFSLGTQTVAQLTAAATAGAGALAWVSDATATTARSTVAGGGANKVLVMSDAANWLIVA